MRDKIMNKETQKITNLLLFTDYTLKKNTLNYYPSCSTNTIIQFDFFEGNLKIVLKINNVIIDSKKIKGSYLTLVDNDICIFIRKKQKINLYKVIVFDDEIMLKKTFTYENNFFLVKQSKKNFIFKNNNDNYMIYDWNLQDEYYIYSKENLDLLIFEKNIYRVSYGGIADREIIITEIDKQCNTLNNNILHIGKSKSDILYISDFAIFILLSDISCQKILVYEKKTKKVSYIDLPGEVQATYNSFDNLFLILSVPFKEYSIFKLNKNNESMKEIFSYKQTSFIDSPSLINFANISMGSYRTKKKTDTAIIHLHGGPHDYWRKSYNPYLEWFTDQYIDVYVPNYNGSSINKVDSSNRPLEWSNKEIQEIEIIFLHLKKSYKNVIFSGESYGAYLVLRTSFNNKINASKFIMISPFYSAKSLFKKGNNSVKKTLQNHAQKIWNSEKLNKKINDKNFLIIHGMKDTIIPYSESLSILKKLKKNSSNTKCILILSDGHQMSPKFVDKIESSLKKFLALK